MKVHNDLKELLEDFCYRIDLTECMDSEFSWQEIIIPYVSSNSLALGKPEPLAKNKQAENKCKVCGHSMQGEPFQICNDCDDDEGLS